VKKGIDHMAKTMIFGLIRHALTTSGGYFVGTGLIGADDYSAALGAVMTLGGILWSAFEKYQAHRKSA
jgi:hypothetical protein